MAKLVSGKAPISTKSSVDTETSRNIANTIPGAPKSLTDIPAECKKELKSKNLAHRWIDIVELKKNLGFHKQEWQPYKFECLTNQIKNNPFADSASGYEGFLLRKQLVLAVKTAEEANNQRNYIKFKNNMQANPGQKAVDQFKEFAGKDSGMKVEGWDNKDEEELK